MHTNYLLVLILLTFSLTIAKSAELKTNSSQEVCTEIIIYLTAKNTGSRLTRKQSISFEKQIDKMATISIDSNMKFQEIEGFGGSFTEAAAIALSKISPEKREEIINKYFDPMNGLGYSLCRTHINSCDFSLNNYSYDDFPGDTQLKQFNIEHDKKLLIPLIKDAMSVKGAKFKLFASPWSPPAWMKDNNEMNHGGKLKPQYASTWAKYYAKYIKAYEKLGIPIWAITVQNEPAAVQTWDSCIYSAQEERDFVKYHLGPTLKNEKLGKVKIIIWDHNKDIIIERAEGVLSDAQAAKYVWGTGFHWYGGEHFENLDYLNEKYPDKKLLFTEGCIEKGPRIGSWDTGERYGHNIIGDLNHFAVGWVDWNIVLDEHGGPNHANNFCDAPVIADGNTNTVIYQSSFYYLGHFSKFIRPGAVRIGCISNNQSLEATAFLNKNGSKIVVVMNPGNDGINFSIGWKKYIANLNSPAHSIMTLIF